MHARIRNGAAFVQVAEWDDGTWAGIESAEDHGVGVVWLFNPTETDGWIQLKYDPNLRWSPKFSVLSRNMSLALHREKVVWFFHACAGTDVQVNGLAVGPWYSEAAYERGHFEPGFDPEPHVLLGELHPVWTSDRSWVQIEEGS